MDHPPPPPPPLRRPSPSFGVGRRRPSSTSIVVDDVDGDVTGLLLPPLPPSPPAVPETATGIQATRPSKRPRTPSIPDESTTSREPAATLNPTTTAGFWAPIAVSAPAKSDGGGLVQFGTKKPLKPTSHNQQRKPPEPTPPFYEPAAVAKMMQTSLPVFATTPPPPGSSRSASPSFSGYHTDTSASAAEPRSVLGSASSISAPDLPDDHDDFDDGASVWETEDHQAAADQQAEGQIEVDDHELGSDLGYESEGQVSASTSLDSGMRDYIFENGRRYHRFREGRYNFPNDDVEYVFSPSPVCVCVCVWLVGGGM